MVNRIKDILKIGLPIMLGQACIIILAFADNIMLGWYGVNELAAASFVNGVLNLLIMTELGFACGMTPIIGAKFGRNDINGIGKTLKNGIYLNSIVAVLSIFILLAIYFNLHRFGQDESLLPLIKPYFAVVGISTIFALGFNTLKQFTDGICKTMVAMAILMGGNLLNILGNWLLIFGKAGFPEMGLLGAGISTLVARIAMLAVFVAYILFSKSLRQYAKALKASIIDRESRKHLYNMGYPLALQTFMETSTFTASTVMVGWLGAMSLAAHQIALTISQLFFMMLLGLSSATSVLISGAYGRQNVNDIKGYAFNGYILSLLFSATTSVLIYIFRYNVIGLFTDSPEVTSISVSLLFVLFTYQFGDCLQLVFSNSLRGIQDVKPIMAMAFISYYLIAIPAAYFLGFKTEMGIIGIWAGFPVGLTIAGLFYFVRFHIQVKRIRQTIHAEPSKS